MLLNPSPAHMPVTPASFPPVAPMSAKHAENQGPGAGQDRLLLVLCRFGYPVQHEHCIVRWPRDKGHPVNTVLSLPGTQHTLHTLPPPQQLAGRSPPGWLS